MSMKHSKEELLKYVVEISARAGVPMAIGGGLAVCAHGYRRNTSDVDAFFHARDRQKVVREIRRTFGDNDLLEELDASHWIFVPAGNTPDERVDLRFASGDPEESAIETSVVKNYQDVSIPVFAVDMLVATKYLAGREDPKDALDIYALWRRGTYDPSDVQTRLVQMGFKQDAADFPKLLEYLDHLPRSTRKKTSTS